MDLKNELVSGQRKRQEELEESKSDIPSIPHNGPLSILVNCLHNGISLRVVFHWFTIISS